MQAYKIDVRYMTEQEKKDVQNAFFMLGYKWKRSEATYKHLDKPFYFAEFEAILYCEGAEYFFNDKDCEDNKQITYEELMALAYGDNTMKRFTKSDLKTGMIIETTEGKFAMVLLGTENGDIVSGGEWYPLSSYSDYDLFEDTDTHSFKNVYQPKSNIDYRLLTDKGDNYHKLGDTCTLVWGREQSKITQQQKQLQELKAAQEQLLLQAKALADKIDVLQRSAGE